MQQFYPEEMPASIYINFTPPQRRVRWYRIAPQQKRLLTLLLRDLFTVNIWLFNKQFNKHFCCTTWPVGTRCEHTMSRLNPLPYFWEYDYCPGLIPGEFFTYQAAGVLSDFTSILCTTSKIV